MESSEIKKEIIRLGRKLTGTMGRDRFVLQRELRNVERRFTASKPEGVARALEKIEKRISDSRKTRGRRKQGVPRIRYNPDLPVTARKDEIVELIRNNPVVIIAGETGSGKTTQIPKFCLEAGRGIGGKIACTQPRRIAAVTVSGRIAEELGEEVGQSVGYKIRFHDKGDDDAYIKIMTDGILLAEAQNDRFLNEYDTIIVDEAHERSLNIDFILGILRTLVKKRRDLKIIITSATIDTEKFSRAFGNAPIIEVTGRTYPVELTYSPPGASNNGDEEQTYVERAVRAVEDLQRFGPYGDILVFMPTEADIRETCELIEGRQFKWARVMPLFARLSASDQKKIFAPVAGRKIVVATNVAETSITIPGIKYVVDSGMARIPSYSPRSRTTSLPVMAISRSSADQRMGRCGRVENGVCIRLYDEADYESRPLFTLPEILRANLGEVILRMISLRLGEIEAFPFVDPPSAKSIKDGFDTLLELGAIKPAGKQANKVASQRYVLTEKGRVMAAIPVDPKLSRILIEASQQGCLEDVLVIISALSIRDPRDRPTEKAQQADQKHAAFKDPLSDFLTLLNIWKVYHRHMKEGRGMSRMKKFCKENFLSFMRMREWMDIHSQLTRTLKDCNLEKFKKMERTKNSAPKKGRDPFGEAYTAIHKSILSGYLSNIAVKKEKNIYTATKGRETMIFPGSGLFNKAGQWMVASEMVETSRLYARNVANIDNDWLEELGKAQCRYSYSRPRWEKSKGNVMASEHVSLFGLTIVAERNVIFGRIDPVEASKIFIRSALVEGDLELERQGKNFSFLKHNLELVDQVRDTEDRVRRRDILVSEDDLFEFYYTRLDDIYDLRTLASLIRKRGGDDFLKFTRRDLERYVPESDELALYPENISLGGRDYACEYNFSPGKEKDGVTVKIPSGDAASVPRDAIDWMVPGLIREKIENLIKGLPKEYRKKLVPVASSVDTIIKEMPELNRQNSKNLPEKPMVAALGQFIFKRFGVNIPAGVWSDQNLPHHLNMRISITDPKGKEIDADRDKNILKKDYSKGIDRNSFRQAKMEWEKADITGWAFDDLPDHVILKGDDSSQWTLFPGLTVEGESLALRLHQRRGDATSHHREGVGFLLKNHFSREMKLLKKEMVLPGDVKSFTNYFGGEKKFNQRMVNRVVTDLFHKNIRSAVAFKEYAGTVSSKIHPAGTRLLKVTAAILKSYHHARSYIYDYEVKQMKGAAPALAVEIRKELDLLVPENFIDLYDNNRLVHVDRYIRANTVRARRGFENPDKDRTKAVEVKQFTGKLGELVKSLTPEASDEKRESIEAFFWMIEEYKVSLFAQELKTPVRVSKKRLEKMADDITRMV